MTSSTRAALDAMIAEATVDCYDHNECVMGFYTMICEHLATPFSTSVLGVEVLASDLDLSDDDQIVVICRRGQWEQRISVLELPLPTPPPGGAEWIDAYRHWSPGR